MKKLISLTLINFVFASAQEIDIDSNYVVDLEKNMTAYRLYYTEGLDNCSSTIIYTIDNYILDKDQHYDIRITRVNELSYQNKTIDLYEIKNNYYTIEREGFTSKVSFSHGESYENLLCKRILIGLEKDKKQLVFISGNIFKTCIANDFDIDKPETFYNFLELKLYNYNVKELKFVQKKKRFMIFKAFSKTLNEEIIIKMNIHLKDYDLLQVKSTRSNYTETGSYHWKK